MNEAAERFVSELSILVEKRQRLEIKLKSLTSELDALLEENLQLKDSLSACDSAYKKVLRFAMDHVERHYSSVSTQRELVDLLSQTRSIRSPQSFSWIDFRA